ncbi:MAG: Uma2 family endonuclease [Thermaerobacter sp.]|nr:Uma2 family endonuclease [Thermaerobacter sp.]
MDKKAAYLAAGVPHYWVIDPQGQTLTAFRLMEGEYRLEGRFEGNASFEPEGFLGLTVDLAGVWA